MMDYTTPKGIHNLHTKIDQFVQEAGNEVEKLVNGLVDRMVKGLDNMDEDSIGSTVEALMKKGPADKVEGAVDDVVFEVFRMVEGLLDVLKSFLPTVIVDIKFAKKEVSSVSSTLKSVFGIFKEDGPKIFNEVASLYKSIWITYYILFIMLTILILFYAFWSYDWFKPDADEGPRQPQENQALECCCKFLDCLRDCQDSNLCFWSCVLISEAVILTMFIVSILFCIVAGIKAFIAFGCAQIYVLGDDGVCTGIMTGLQEWMGSFWEDMPSHIHDACESNTLVTCKAISHDLMSSAQECIFGSFMAAFFSLQLLFLSAKLHERARYNHVIEDMINDEGSEKKNDEKADD
jgi:phage-related minor tail protein